MKQAIIYTRVSTDEQADKGYSLPTQLVGCRQYASADGFGILAELADDCSGTIPIYERPEGQHIYEFIGKGGVDAVIIFTHDRTARDERALEYLIFKSELYDCGVELHYTDTGIDAVSMEGDLIGHIRAYEAARERLKIIERTSRGQECQSPRQSCRA